MAFRTVVKKRRPRRFLGAVIIIVISVGLSMLFYNKVQEARRELDALNAEKKRFEIVIEKEKKRKSEIEQYGAYVQTKSYIEQVARDVLGLVYKNEVIFKAEE